MYRELRRWAKLGRGFLTARRRRFRGEADYKTIDDAVEEVKEKTGAEKVNLFGHSLGGIIALDYALDRPENVEDILTVASPFRGTYGILYSNLMRPAGLHDPVVYDMLLPFGKFMERLRYKMYRQWKQLEKEPVNVMNIIASEDEFVGEERMSLLAAIGKRENIVEFSLPEGHCEVLFNRQTVEQLRFMMQNGAATVGVHSLLYDQGIFDSLREGMTERQREDFYTFNYDYHRIPETRYH